MNPIILPIKGGTYLKLSIHEKGFDGYTGHYCLEVERAPNDIVGALVWLAPDELSLFIEQIGRLKDLLNLA